MKIVFLRSNSINPDSRVEKQVTSLIEFGHIVNVIGWDREKKYKKKHREIIIDNIKIDVLTFGIISSFGNGFKKNLFPLIIFQVKLFFWLLKNYKSYDVIHACDLDTAFIATISSIFTRKKIVYDIFDYYVDSFNVPKILTRIVEKIDIFVMNKANHVIICSEERRAQIKKANPKKISVIHNSPKFFDVNNVKKLNRNNLSIVYVGILSKHRFLEEIADVIKENKNYTLNIAGFGFYEEYFKTLDDEYENIIFHGKISYEDTLKLEAASDVILAIYDPKIRNHYFAAPNKFYESLMLGIPIIMAKDTGMANIIEEFDYGVTIDYNKSCFEEALKKIENKKVSFKSKSIQMQNKFMNHYDWNKMKKILEKIYLDLER